MGFHAADLGPVNLNAMGKAGSGQGDRNDVARRDVFRPTDDLQDFARDLNFCQAEFVGIGVGKNGSDPSRDDCFQPFAALLNRGYFQSAEGQSLSQDLRGEIPKVNKLG
jgi:hypothetical protein